MPLLDPTRTYPMVMPDGTQIKTVVHLNRVIDHPRIEIGDFTYFGHLEALEDYAAYLAPYTFPLSPEKLVIGKFCQIAHGARIVTSSANHDMSGFSTFPFANFMMTPETGFDDIKAMFDVPGRKGDTVIGNDVWIGMEAVIMPGVTIGDGAIISARSVVTQDVPPYTIMGGNPATPLKQRFNDATVARLLALAWWNWPVDTIEANIDVIMKRDIDALERAAPQSS
ncbi:MAG: CatB-related O-acetyltransferase [Sphingobium sp.]|nr:CatB-related O-acetyltransferase [Sphingobium sp.]MCP5398322.1 CatB-related O-acetyltransferase [Sphingomonas sp.]